MALVLLVVALISLRHRSQKPQIRKRVQSEDTLVIVA